jgi:hypothetical protein
VMSRVRSIRARAYARTMTCEGMPPPRVRMGDLFQPELTMRVPRTLDKRGQPWTDGRTTTMTMRCRYNIWHYKENTRHARAVTRTRATRKANPKRARRTPRVLSPFDVPRSRPTYLVESLRYAMRSARSSGFFKPAKTIFVPGMYFFGFNK